MILTSTKHWLLSGTPQVWLENYGRRLAIEDEQFKTNRRKTKKNKFYRSETVCLMITWRKNQIWRSFLPTTYNFFYRWILWLINTSISQVESWVWQSLTPYFSGSGTVGTQHPGGWGREPRVFQRAPGIVSNRFSLLRAPLSDPALVTFPLVVPKSRASHPLWIMAQAEKKSCFFCIMGYRWV